MPDMNGYEVLERLKKDDLTRHIPVIIISVLEEEKKKIIKSKAADYISKPIDEERLYKKILKNIKSQSE